jgi:hypothetical protein
MNAPLESAVQPPVLRADADGIATLTLNRPAQFNAINGALLAALHAELAAIAADRSARVVVLAGAGRAFCPGHDLKEMLANSNEAFIGELFRRCCDAMLAIRGLPQPVIARVHGIATAAGCQIVAACDLAIRRGGRALRDLRHQPRPLLRDARRSAVAQPLDQTGVRNADDRRLHRRRDRPRLGTRQPRRACGRARRGHRARSRTRSWPSRRRCSPRGKRFF